MKQSTASSAGQPAFRTFHAPSKRRIRLLQKFAKEISDRNLKVLAEIATWRKSLGVRREKFGGGLCITGIYARTISYR